MHASELLARYAAGQRDFRWATLHGANLEGATLTGVDLHRATLTWATLTEANMQGADLTEANLREANLHGADLTDATLTDADLCGADLFGANLPWADLRGADLTEADLRGANLPWATLHGANLTWVDLTDATLTGADLTGARLLGAQVTAGQLRAADLAAIRDDLYGYLAHVPDEVAGLLAELEAGRIDGSLYSGPCACLAGTCERLHGLDNTDGGNPLANLRDSSSPRERWFLAISRRNTPATNPVAAITAEWLRAWLAAPPTATAPDTSA